MSNENLYETLKKEYKLNNNYRKLHHLPMIRKGCSLYLEIKLLKKPLR